VTLRPGQAHDFCLTGNFFFFLVGRNSVTFAPPCPRKSFAAYRLGRGSGAKWSEFRPGGAAKFVSGEAKFVAVSHQPGAFPIAKHNA
jgi:hypothetical protein